VRPLAAPPAPIPTFSVVVAVYQSAGLVGEAVASALDQAPAPHEVVVCDDGSTDDPAAQLARFGDRVVVLRKEHGGAASAKNAGLAACSGDFVVFLDADDAFLPDRLATLGAVAAARPDLDLLSTDAYLEVAGTRVRRAHHAAWPFAVDDQRAAILERNFIPAGAAVRRSVLLAAGGFDEALGWTSDWECWIRLILGGALAGLVDVPLYRYRLHESSLSADGLGVLRGMAQTLAKTAARDDLTTSEREALERTRTRRSAELALAEARAALAGHEPGARRQALSVAFAPSYALRTRLKCLASAALPGVAQAVLERRRRVAWDHATGVRIAREI
jgi:hypothetical protein